MRILFQILNHDNPMRLSVALSAATAAKQAGHEVLLFLAADGAYVADPDTYHLGPKVAGLPSAKELAQALRDQNVPFYVSQSCAEFRDIKAHANVVHVTFEQLAHEMANCDHVVTY